MSRPAHPYAQLAGAALALLSAAAQAADGGPVASAGADEEHFLDHFELRNSNTVELRYDDLKTSVAGAEPRQRAAVGWFFSNETLVCNLGACNGSQLVFRPRLTWQASPYRDPDLYFHELYISANLPASLSLRVGKQVEGWGPGILYSPTNRAFAETLFTAVQREPIGHRGLTLSLEALPGLTFFGTVERADELGLTVPTAEWSTFASARAELQRQGAHPLIVGAVVGGGKRYQLHEGLYFQILLDDAWTVGAETSVSRGYLRNPPPQYRLQGLFLREDSWGFDGLANIRYGLPSGGELAAEVGLNQFGLGPDARGSLPFVYPSLHLGTQAGAAIHPFLDQSYGLVQARLPDLPPGKHLTLLFTAATTRPSGSVIVAGEVAYLIDAFRLFVSAALNFGPDWSVLRFPAEQFFRVGVSYSQ